MDETAAFVPVAAIRVLYSTKRRAAEYDILVATALECLARGGRTGAELHSDVQKVWPGARIDPANVVGALAAAEAAQLVIKSNATYRLAESGMAEVERSRQWAEEVHRRTAALLQEKADRSLRPITSDEARLWVGWIAYALLRAVAVAAGAYRGDVNLINDSLIAPRSIEKSEIRRALGKANIAPETVDFLEAMVIEAIDPSEPFGNELVSSITTGYLLQAFLARRDAIAARSAIGPLAGQVVILDTPLLFQLLTPPSVESPFSAVVQTALNSHVEVVYCKHSMEELLQVLRRIERDHGVEIARATQNSRTLGLFRRLVAEPLIEMYLNGFVVGDFTSWTQFREHVKAFDVRLASHGIQQVEHGNGPDDHVDDLFSRLSAVIDERRRAHTSDFRRGGRGVEEARRDANTMAYAWRVRRLQPRPGVVWPASWVLTTDTAMSIAYRRTNKADTDGLTVSPSQWTSIVSAFAAPAEIEELAKSGATMLAQETMLRVAARYPAVSVMEIADALADTATESDIRTAQLSLDGLLRDMPSLGTDPRALGVAVASKMLAERARRLDQVQASHTANVLEDRRRAEDARSAGAAVLESERKARLLAEATVASGDARHAKEQFEWQKERARGRRRLIQLAVVGLLAGVAVVSGMVWALTDVNDALAGPLAVSILLSTLIIASTSESWVVEERWGAKEALLALIPQLLALPGLLQSFGIKLP